MITVEALGSRIVVFSEKGKIDFIDTFRPYFYVPDPNGPFTSILGEKCKKIFVNHPKDVPIEKVKYGKSFEADVFYTNRFIIDSYKEIPKQELNLLYIDIETEMDETGFHPIEEAKNKIQCIGTYSNK